MTEITIATLNTWGIAFSRERRRRLQAVALATADPQYDIIGLQEVWLEFDYEAIARAATAAGRHVQPFASGAIGSGLVIVSRFPFERVHFRRYRSAGSPETAYHGDLIAGKGIGLARLRTPGGALNVFISHLIAQYHPDEADTYAPHRTAQMLEAVWFINSHADGLPSVLVGDLNNRPDQTGWRIITQGAAMRDVYASLHPDAPGITFSAQNPLVKSDEPDQRIDYVMVRDGEAVTVTPQHIEVAFQAIPGATLKGQPLPYADHYGLVARLRLDPASGTVETGLDDALRHEIADTLAQGITIAERRRCGHVQSLRLIAAAALLMLAVRPLRRALPFAASLGLLRAWFALAIRAEQRDLIAILAEFNADQGFGPSV